jgi:spermidine synthase
MLLLILFFLSGAAALIYEVVWIRLLTLTLSITVYSLTTVLCAFMAGLAIGAGISAALADRVRRPLRGFALLELGIGVCGLLVPGVLGKLGSVYIWLHQALGGQGIAFLSARFALAFLVLLVPTTLMGITLPLLSRAVIEDRGMAGRGAGSLYAANTIGAVAGCVLAGFVLVPTLGLLVSSAGAALLNFGIAACAWVIARGAASPSALHAPRRERAALPPAARLAALAFAISGFTAMGYEVLWTRALEHYTHNSTYAYTAMLATFLAGLGAGSGVMARHADRIRRPMLALGVVQLAIGASVVVALTIYVEFEALVPSIGTALGRLTSWPRVIALIFSEAGLVMLGTTFLLGMVFPLVARIAVDALGVVGHRIGVAYLANTLGSIIGALAVGFLVLPAWGMRNAFLGLVSVNIGLGFALCAVALRWRSRLALAGLAAAAIAGAFAIVAPNLFEAQFVARFGKVLDYREEVTDTIMVTEEEDGSRMIRYADGRGTAGTGTVIGDRMYGHSPLLLHPDPRRVLQITFGVGNSLASVLTHPVEHVDCVELSPGVIEAAPYFRATNRDALRDPRVELLIGDGRNFLLTSRERYDVIRLDPPELHTAGVVNLYTREFYELARDHLAEGGIFSIWINNVMTPEPEIRMILRTLAAVFPHVSVWHDPAMFSWIINGSVDPHAPDLGLLLERFRDPAIQQDLASIGIPDPFHFLRNFVFSGEALEQFSGAGPLVVDDHTRIDFSVPRSADAFYGISNLNTDYFLMQLMGPGSGRDVAFRTFIEKVTRLARYKRDVLPELANIEASGLGIEEVRRRIESAADALPVRGGGAQDP